MGKAQDVGSDAEQEARSPGVMAAMAGLAAGAGVIHFAMVPVHAGSGLLDPIAFALIGWFQVVLAALLIARASFSRPLCLAAIYGNGAVLGIWAWSRTTGLPIGSSNGQVESIEAIDLIASLFEAAVVLLALVVLYAPRRFEIPQLGAVVVGISALALATSVIVQPEAAAHGHGENSVAAAGHHGATADPALVASIEKDRCDVEFNPKGYWQEAAMLGIDTHAGGAMDMTGISPLNLAAQDGGTSPLGGRGSETLDEIVSFSSAANGSEAAEARLVVALAGATDAEYGEWLRWMAKNGGGHTAHGSGTTAAPDDTQGHGGHVGPQTWTALVDEDACARLADELEISRKTALQYPTAADAVRAGWRKVTGYVPGIAAHYMNFKLVDGTFKIDEPEMILYDGDGDDAHVVGLSYYLVHDGDAEPTQGFTGDNDHYHRHIGLCINNGGVIADSTTTESECAELGGRKQQGGKGWMSHAWVVPGCESPWGVFSGANPILDREVGQKSGHDGAPCSSSTVLDRYDLSPGTDATPSGKLAVGAP